MGGGSSSSVLSKRNAQPASSVHATPQSSAASTAAAAAIRHEPSVNQPVAVAPAAKSLVVEAAANTAANATANAAAITAEPADSATPQREDDWDDWDDGDENDENGGDARNQPGDASTVVQPSKHACAEVGGSLILCSGASDEQLSVSLKCSSCGHPVLRFPASRWAKSIDYFHLRNFAPDARMPERMQEDLAKLCPKLERDEATAAYACGCSWQTITDDKAIDASGSTPAVPHGGARLPEDEQVLCWQRSR